MSKIEIWFEFASTYSYPAVLRIRGAARAVGVDIEWKAFLLGPIFKDLGWNDSPFNLQPAKGRYMWRDLERICAAEALPFRRPSVFPRNGLCAARVAAYFQDQPWIADFIERVYRANFADDTDITDREVLAACLGELGLDSRAILETALGADGKARLRAQTEEAIRKGIFGAPTFIVGDEMFWGNDRLDAAIAQASAETGRPGETAAPRMLPVTKPPADLEAIEAATRSIEFAMASDRETGALLRSLAHSKPAGRLLEIGTGTGLATAWLADGMRADGMLADGMLADAMRGGATLLSIDSDPSVVELARTHLGDMPHVELRVGDAGALLAQIQGPYDLIFADAWPGKFSHLDLALDLLAPGGVYVIDDLLPQPNWPAGHADEVDRLLADLGSRTDLTVCQLNWSTGIAIVTRER